MQIIERGRTNYKKMENWTQKWIRPNMVLNISHFGLELGHLRREKRRGKEEKERREEEKKKLLRYGY